MVFFACRKTDSPARFSSSNSSGETTSADGLFSEKFPGTTVTATAAQTMDTLSIALNGMSVAAACEKPIIATVDGKSNSTQRAFCQPQRHSASHANASVASNAHTALGRRALPSLTPNNLKHSAADQ